MIIPDVGKNTYRREKVSVETTSRNLIDINARAPGVLELGKKG